MERREPTRGVGEGSRLMSLDALRGLCIVIMLLVNNFGSAQDTPDQFQHAKWGDGLHVADMAFPWFLLCVGLSIPFSALSANRKGMTTWQYDLRVFRRTLILLALGAILVSSGDWQIELFSVGVLQTIALSYLITALLYDMPGYRRLFISAFALVGYWAAIKYLPVPGEGAGAFDDGRNLIHHLNSEYLGRVGLWNLTRIVPTTALVMLGSVLGDLLPRKDMKKLVKAYWLLGAGALLICLGFVWNLSLPFNKWVWTPSYILFSAGTGSFLLGFFVLSVDMVSWGGWAYPLIVLGSNAILAYLLPIVVKALVFSPLNIYIGGWLGMSLFNLAWWVFFWLLYRKRWFVRV